MSEPNGGFTSSDSGGDGSSYSGSDNSSYAQPSQQTSEANPAGNNQSQGSSQHGQQYPGFNTAWNGLLGKLPTQLHPVIADDLRQFDRNYQQLAQQYAPYKAYAQQGITADHINMGMELVDMLNKSPQEFYRRLGETLGISAQQAQQAVEGDSDTGEYDQSGYEDPRDQQLQQMQEQMQWIQDQWTQGQQQQQYQQEVNQTEQAIDYEIQRLKATDPNFDVGDVLRRVYVQLANNQPINIGAAYAEHKAYDQQVQNRILQGQSAGNSAPRAMPTNGGMPPTAQNTQPKTQDERVARAAAMIQASQSR